VTLRFRLVSALAAMLIAGLGVFGWVTYRIYAHNEFQNIDRQLRQAAGPTAQGLKQFNNLDSPAGTPGDGGGGPGGPPQRLDPRFLLFSELLDDHGSVVAKFTTSGPNSSATETAAPELPATLPASGSLITTGSTIGSSEWRVLVIKNRESAPYNVVVAVSTTEVQKSLDQLVLIEAISALALLLVLAAGSWLILRRGLHPLEAMADSARSISAGDLSRRVGPADGKSEVGQLGLALNTMLDELQEAFEERQATEQKLRQFLADASHELRTPLTSIQGFAELFRLGSATGADPAHLDRTHIDQAIIMRRIEEESARMKRLVEDLLLLARLDETRPMTPTPVDLAVLAADACSDAAATAPDRSITLDAADPVVILGDRDHLRQAIANLMTNAIGHTAPGTPIHVGARMDDGHAVLTVRDEGRGLDEAAIAHVFDRFWRADKARVGSGAGLGLSIVEGIAGEHGGNATAANDPRGGAVFTISLPLDSAHPSTGAPRKDHAGGTAGWRGSVASDYVAAGADS
jgi:two-component system, OmpR family, sensor kinase